MKKILVGKRKVIGFTVLLMRARTALDTIIRALDWKCAVKHAVLFAVFLGASLPVTAADPVPGSRLLYGGSWEGRTGVIGGIPNRTIQFANLTSSATVAQINSAIANCPSGQYVHLSAGTYALSGVIDLSKSGVTLRGDVNASGVPTTILKNVTIRIGDGWDFGSTSGWTMTTVSSGASRGSTQMTFASVSGLTVGRLVWVHASGSATVTGDNWSDIFGLYPVSQVMKVTAINGTTVTFEQAFNPDYWTGTIRAAWRPAGDQTSLAGIENISLTPSGATAGYGSNYIEVRGADECWIKNVKTYDIASQNTHHVWVYGSYRLEIRHCDMSRMRSAEGSGDSSNNYCVLLSHSGSWLIEDNYFHQVPNVMPMFDSGGGAFAYNYINDLPYGRSSPGWLSQIVFNHGSHMHYNLFEGNWCAGSYNEEGTSGSRNTIWFRNRMLGWDPNPSQNTPKDANTNSIVIASGHNNMILAGNVMGKVGYHSSYQTADTVAGGGSDTFPEQTVIHVHNSALSTLLKIGNYNTVNGVIPVGEAVTGSDVLATSYLHSSKPVWFGDRPWPPFDPSSPAAAVANNLPSGYRAAFGVDPPTGPSNQPPVANGSANPTSGSAPLTVAFSSAGSSDPEGAPLTYSWNFGDASPLSTAANPSHTYTTSGAYVARLTVSDGTNSTTSNPINIGVGNLPPTAVANATPRNGAPPLVVAFSSTGSSDPEGAILTYSWDFGDASPLSTAANPSHTYTTLGSYTARLTVSDGTNSATSGDINIVVANQPPTAVVSATPRNGAPPLVVAFSSAGSSDPEGAPLTYSWNFGDASPLSTAANPNHTYATIGSYTARLTVSDGTNSTTSSGLVITVTNSLVAAYGFEEASGSSVTDVSSSANNGTITGATRTTAGRFGKALSFGSGALVTVNDSASLDLTAGMTLEAWAYPTAFSGSWMTLIMKPSGNPSSGNPCYVLQGSTPPSSAPSLFISSASSNLIAPSPLPLNTWSHVAATYDGTTMRLYVNGVQVGSRAQTGAMTTSTDALTIGGNAFAGGTWTGLIDEVRIYNRALSATEIQTDMNTAVVPRPAPPTNLRVVSQ